ncbi:hypothetical protein CapIbe_009339 [Capra ibex]
MGKLLLILPYYRYPHMNCPCHLMDHTFLPEHLCHNCQKAFEDLVAFYGVQKPYQRGTRRLPLSTLLFLQAIPLSRTCGQTQSSEGDVGDVRDQKE